MGRSEDEGCRYFLTEDTLTTNRPDRNKELSDQSPLIKKDVSWLLIIRNEDPIGDGNTVFSLVSVRHLIPRPG